MNDLMRRYRLERLKESIGQLAGDAVPDARVTVIVRNPADAELYAMVGDDEPDQVVELIRRVQGRPYDTSTRHEDVPDFIPDSERTPHPLSPRDRALIPTELIQGLLRYAGDGRVATGGFLRCVLENDLQGALARAHGDSLRALPAITAFIYNELPGPCWGSKAKVNAWLRRRPVPVEE